MTTPNLAMAQQALLGTPYGAILKIACLAGLLAYALVRLKRRGFGQVETAARYAEAGQFDTAIELLVALGRAKGAKNLHAQAALAHLQLRRGHLGHAVSVLASIGSRTSTAGRALRRSSNRILAYAFAVGGDLESAEQEWSVTARLREPLSPLGCLLLCKRGRFDELVDISTRSALVPKVATSLAPAFEWHGERVVALLCGFAYAQHSAQSATTVSIVEKLLVAARPTYAGEYDYLLANWAELRSFVAGQEAHLRVQCSERFRSCPPSAWVIRGPGDAVL